MGSIVSRSVSRSAVLAAALWLFVPAAASATDPGAPSASGGCPEFFPDFSCEREARFPGFVMPSTAPYLFEDPFTTTGAYFWGAWHQFPESSVFEGGNAGLLALALRVAITERLSFVASKDGFLMIYPDNPILWQSSGAVDLAGGFKYELVRMPEVQFVLSPVLRFEAPVGSPRAFQGIGHGAALPSLSFGKGFGEIGASDLHLLGDIGVFIPFNAAHNSSYIWYDVHFDYRVADWFVPFVSLNGQSWVSDGNGELRVNTKLGELSLNTAQAALGTGGFEGVDLTNLGSRDVAGSTVLVGGVGFRIPLPHGLSISAAWQAPLTSTKYLWRQRVTTGLAWEF